MASDKLKTAMEATGEDLEMDMSSMIDLVFLLLIFFMVSSHLIIIQIDRRVRPPTADHAQVAKVTGGRIVLNVLEDGTIWGLNEEELPTTTAVTDYVDQIRVMNDGAGIESRLHLRADKYADARDIKRAIQAAGEAGVNEVIFGSFVVERD